MSAAESLAADALPPLESKVILVDVAVAAVNAVADISAGQGRFITVQNTGANPLCILFGDAATVADPAAVAGVTRCMELSAGEQRDYRYEEGLAFERPGTPGSIAVTHIAYRTTAGAGEIRVTVS
jgi:hypothetical protein